MWPHRRLKRIASRSVRIAQNIRWRRSATPSGTEASADLLALDGHSSVIPDIASVSGMPSIEHILISDGDSPEIGSYQTREFTKGLQPFTWDWANRRTFQKFVDGHFGKLANYKGFVAAHPSSFAAIYAGFHKPVLMNISTRFEYPFTVDRKSYEWLLERLIQMHKEGVLFPVANNLADKEYFELLTGLPAEYAPSLTSYVRAGQIEDHSHKPSGPKVIFAKSEKLVSEISELTGGTWLGVKQVFKHRYSWRDLGTIAGAFVVPYNVSTMTLFELAQLNVPLVLPSMEMTRKLITSGYSGVLSELHFTEVMGLHARKGVGYRDPLGDLNWWFERSDFVRSPLVSALSTFIDSPKDLMSAPLVRLGEAEHGELIAEIEKLRAAAYKSFIRLVRGI